MLKSLRNAFISGLLLLAPIGVTVFVIQFLVERIGSPTSNLFFWFVSPEIFDQKVVSAILNILATVYVLLAITLLGYLSRIFIGRMLVQWVERVIVSVPFANSVYNTVKQIVDTFSQQKQAVFQRVVLIEWPQKKNYVIGFLTGSGKGEVQHRTSADILNIFVPTTPNPTSGYLVMVPQEMVTDLDMSVTDGMKLIISGGAVAPPWRLEGGVPIRNPQNIEGATAVSAVEQFMPASNVPSSSGPEEPKARS